MTNTIAIPERMRRLPVWNTKPVPWFAAWFNGIPDFRVIAQEKLGRAVRENLCWVCGERLGKYKTFVLGPMCAINRVISEPPSHRDCARYSAVVCPFLSDPAKGRREHALPDQRVEPAGVGIRRNPGCVALWTTFKYTLFRTDHANANPGVLFQVGEPESVEWIAAGREATRAEVLHSVTTGLPLLRSPAEEQGPEAMAELERCIERAHRYFPAEHEAAHA